jgi:hypothetical protein
LLVFIVKKIRLFPVFAGTLLLPLQAAFAAGPYVVDDADIVEPNKIQIESWYNHSSTNENTGTIDAAYQLLPHAEFTLLNAYDVQSGGNSDLISPQVKYKWRDGDDGKEVASSAVFGFNYSATHNGFSNMFAYIPSTLTLNDIVDINADLGWQYDNDTSRHSLTWGIGTELHASESFSFVGEVFNQQMFGQHETRPGLQCGPRYNMLENLQLDLVYGHDITGVTANWITAGFTAVF